MKLLRQDNVWGPDGQLTTEVLLLWYGRSHWLRWLGTRLSSKISDIGLPEELWAEIADCLERLRKTTLYAWASVLLVDARTHPDGRLVLTAREVLVSHDWRESARQTELYEDYLRSPLVNSYWFGLRVPNNPLRWTIWLNGPHRVHLYCNLTSPDIIARLEKGDCWFCEGEHHICPGCTGGVAQELDCFMGCGVDLACPNCMGVAFALDDKAYHETYYWVPAPERVREAREARFNAHLAELGYPLRTWGHEEEEQEG